MKLGKTKLNKIERLKAALKPIEYFKKLNSLDFGNLQESDRFYLKNFGIYTHSQRENEFMLRIRIAGGRISLQKLESIINIADRFNAQILITARAQIELQKLSPQNILNAYKLLEEANLSSWQTLTDNFRNIITDTFDGVHISSKIETYSLILQMQKLFLKKGEFTGMIPRKFNTAIVGSEYVSQAFFGNDCLFALAKKGEKYGFNLYLGGKNNEVAKNMDIFVEKENVVPLFNAVIQSYLNYGNRSSRTKARLFYLIENLGIEGFKEKMAQFCSFEFEKAGKLQLKKEILSDFTKLKNGNYAFRFRTDFGEIKTAELKEILIFAKKNSLEIRLGIDQNIYILGLKEPNFPFKGISSNQNTLVCAGSRYCFFSLFDTKEKVHRLNLEKINRYNIKVGYSGCLKGCGRHFFSDIGFVGIRTNLYGTLERGVRLYLGGLYSQGISGARLIYWAVPLRALNNILAVIIEEFEASGFDNFELFSQNILSVFESEFLAFWFLAKLYTAKQATLKEPKSFNYLLDGKEALVKELKEGKNRLYETIKELERRIYAVISS